MQWGLNLPPPLRNGISSDVEKQAGVFYCVAVSASPWCLCGVCATGAAVQLMSLTGVGRERI